jgi:hypothetical protein
MSEQYWDAESAAKRMDALESELSTLRAERDVLKARIDAKQEPFSVDVPEYHKQGMGCGLEDRDITDRYDAMEYGWDCALERMFENLPEKLYAHPAIPPEGMMLVPVELTEAMSDAAYAVDAHPTLPNTYAHVWRAMLKAVPAKGEQEP